MTPEISKEYGVFWGPELYNYKHAKVPLIEYILYENDVICISSRPGVGKSILALQFVFCLTAGHAFLDTYAVARPCNVLYIQTEGDRAETIERVANMSKGLTIDNARWAHINQAGLMLNTQYGISQLVKLALEPQMQYDVIILDPLYTTLKGSLNNDEVAGDWVRNLRALKGKFNCAMIVLHHEHKDMYHQGQVVDRLEDNVIGSFAWNAFFNQNFKFRVHNGLHTLNRGKQRSGKIVDTVEMKLIEPAPLLFVNNDEHLETSTIKVSKYLKEMDKPCLVKDIAKETTLSLATSYRAIKKLVNNHLVENIVESGNSFYKWKEPHGKISEK